jgi:predicted RNA-binding protein YlxR (DUF448 family)
MTPDPNPETDVPDVVLPDAATAEPDVAELNADTEEAEEVRSGPQTHAQASRERRDITSGEVMDESALIRFVVSPDGVVTPDLARKLPGRGLWVKADRASVDLAVKRGAFSRAAKAKVTAPQDLSDQIERLLLKRVLDGLGLARRSGELTSGYAKAAAAIAGGKAAWLIEASDGAADGRRKMFQVVRRTPNPPRLFGAFSNEDLSLALGLRPVVHLVFLAGRGAGRWTQDVEKLSGFAPLLPQDWPQTWQVPDKTFGPGSSPLSEGPSEGRSE